MLGRHTRPAVPVVVGDPETERRAAVASRRAWLSLLLFPVSLPLAFVVGDSRTPAVIGAVIAVGFVAQSVLAYLVGRVFG